MPLIAEQTRSLKEQILPELEANGIVLAPYQSLSKAERDEADHYFLRQVFPVLTPLAVDPAHPFPYISGLSLNLGLMVQSLDDASPRSERFVRLKVPPVLPGLVQVGKKTKYVFLSDVIAANLGALFPGMSVSQPHAFRVTRDADIEIRAEEADDLLRALQQFVSVEMADDALETVNMNGLVAAAYEHISQAHQIDGHVTDFRTDTWPEMRILHDRGRLLRSEPLQLR